MSNEVYGYLELPKTNKDTSMRSLEERTELGIKEIPFSELYNFPKALLPSNDEYCFAFIIGDKPGKSNATYLTDYVDYAPDADIGFPSEGLERLKLLVNLLSLMIRETGATRLVVAITDSSQIDEVKEVRLDDLMPMIINDFEMCAPPDCLYNVLPSKGAGDK